MWSRFAPVVTLLAVVALTLLPAGNAGQVVASGPSTQSSISVYLNCPNGVSFAEPGAGNSCGSGNYTGVYTGISQAVVANGTSAFYLASATGGVKVTFSVTDLTTGKLLLSGVGYGSMSGGTCASPAVVLPAKAAAETNAINSGDELRSSLNTTFTGTGTPEFCSGGASATLISLDTIVIAGATQPSLTTMLTAGSPYQTTLSGFNGVAQSYVDTGTSSFTAVVVGVVKSSSGSTVDVLVTSVTVSPGTSATAFLKFNQYPTGTYTVSVLAITSSNVPVSTAGVATFSV